MGPVDYPKYSARGFLLGVVEGGAGSSRVACPSPNQVVVHPSRTGSFDSSNLSKKTITCRVSVSNPLINVGINPTGNLTILSCR